MRRAFVPALLCAAGLLTLSGCGSGGGPAASGTTASSATTAPNGSPSAAAPTAGPAGGSSGSSAKGGGTLELTLAAKQQTMTVVCSQQGNTISASGSAGTYAASMTVKGPTLSAVVVQSNPDGSRLISQAINGLRDAAGKPAGKLTVEAAGSRYRGTGTFVVTALNKAGHLVAAKSGSTVAGHFVLDCPAGYAPGLTAPSATTTTAAPAAGATTSTAATAAPPSST